MTIDKGHHIATFTPPDIASEAAEVPNMLEAPGAASQQLARQSARKKSLNCLYSNQEYDLA